MATTTTKHATTKPNGKTERAADVPPSVTPPVESFIPNGDQTLTLDITRGWAQPDWVYIFGGLTVAAAHAHQLGNTQEMFGYMRYANQIGARLGVWNQMANVSDSSPPARAMAAGAA